MNYKLNGKKVSRKTFLNSVGVAGAFVVLALVAVVFVVSTGLTAWVLMLLLGAVHHSLWAAVPALGFWQSVLVAMVLNLITNLFK